jgi:hypothetical protein
MFQAIRSRLTFANLAASMALLFAVGGVSYAATTLPGGSVGTKQLQRHSVTAKKLADKSVKRRALSNGVRRQLDLAGSQAPSQAPAPATAAPASDARSFYSSQKASENPTPETIVDFGGLRVTATCTLNGTTTNVALSMRPVSDAILQDNFNIDTGTDPHNQATPFSGNSQIDLPGGVDTSLGGPGVDAPDYVRVIAVAIISIEGRAMTFNIVELVDGDAETCTVDGTLLAP